jgi:hypothetical protein
MTFRYLKILRSQTTPLLEILNNNIIGTPGQGMLYQHLNVNSKINQIADPYFVNLVRAEQIAGTCCFCHRETINNGQKIRTFYVRYFSFRDSLRRKSVQEKIKSRNSVLRKEIESLLSGEGLDLNPSEKFFHYAYVDPRNKRSAMLCEEFGFEPVRQYTTVIFSRLNPTVNSTDKIVLAKSNESVQELLRSYYHGFNTLSFENLSSRKYYFIENDIGQVVAGVHANPDQWKIHSLPGFLTNLILKVFTRLPILNKLLNEEFKFLTFEGIYLVPGNEKYLERLFESLLAQHNLNSAICIVDPGSNVYPTLKSLRLGLMSKLSKEVRGNVICRFINFSEEEKRTFKTNPVYISGVDAT